MDDLVFYMLVAGGAVFCSRPVRVSFWRMSRLNPLLASVYSSR